MDSAALEGELAGQILETMATGFLLVDAEWRLVCVNALGGRILRAPAADLIGRHIADCLSASQLPITSRWLQRAITSGRPLVVESFDAELGTWFEVRAVPTRGGLGVHFLDITQRRLAQEEIARTAAHLQLLDAVGAELSGVLDTEEAVGRLAGVLVPQLADWCLISLVESSGQLRDLGWSHADPQKEALVAEYATTRDATLDVIPLAAHAMRSGEPVIVDDGGPAAFLASLSPGRARDLMAELAPASGLIMPLRVRGGVLGIISLYRGDDRPALDEDEIATGAEIAGRAALALDGARAYHRAQLAHAATAAAHVRTEQALERLRLLSEVGDALAAGHDGDQGVGRLAELVVPLLADWAVVTLVTEDGAFQNLGWAHRDPSRNAEVAAYAAAQSAAAGDGSPVTTTLRTGRPVIVSELTETTDLGEGPHGLAVLPLVGRGQTLGALTLVTTRERGPHTEAELETAAEVARRAGSALDAARLVGQQRRLSEALQRSLLTAPPEHDGVQVAVRYAPAAQDVQVGGDWYDAFLQPSGAMVIAIGDVMGHDTAAAAAMAQIRGLLRGIAYHGEAGPAAVLAGLDRAIEGLDVGTTATCVLGRLEQTSVERGLGLTRLLWANAGHPPPVVIGGDGVVSVLEDDDPDLLLGISPATTRHEHEAILASGSVVLLYTDGLVERRSGSLDDGIARLRDVLTELAGLPLEELCDAVLARLLPPSAEDDVALVAIKLRQPPGWVAVL